LTRGAPFFPVFAYGQLAAVAFQFMISTASVPGEDIGAVHRIGEQLPGTVDKWLTHRVRSWSTISGRIPQYANVPTNNIEVTRPWRM
jgi:hypothetical protein